MNRCPITYQPCGDKDYSKDGLAYICNELKNLNPFPFTAREQILRSMELGTKLSIQGVQPKLSVKLNLAKESFEIAERAGTFILKSPHQTFQELPQVEDLTMKLAQKVGIETPIHGLIYNIDGSLSYIIKRFDRNHQKIAVEDFAQLLGQTRETKYDSSTEKIVAVINKHCTSPEREREKLFKIVLFNFLIGNEDMHLKNFSLIRHNNKVELSPAYDLVNTTIITNSKEEIALPLRGKKSRLNYSDFIDYFAQERLHLDTLAIKNILASFENALKLWRALIQISFLSETLREKYVDLVEMRWRRLLKSAEKC